MTLARKITRGLIARAYELPISEREGYLQPAIKELLLLKTFDELMQFGAKHGLLIKELETEN